MQYDQTEDSEFQHILVFGPPKSGKTVLVGKLAEHFRLVWLDLDGGVKAIRNNVAPEFHKNINVISMPDSKAFPVAIETTLKIFTGAPVRICAKHGVHQCSACVKDPGAAWTEFCLNTMEDDQILVIDHAAQLSQSCTNFITKGKGDDYKPDWDDWMKQGVLLDRIFSHIQTGRYHCCVITHEMGIEMEDGKEKLVPTCGTRNYSRTFAKFFDHIVYSELFNKKHKFTSSTTGTLNALTGSRTNVALEAEQTPELYMMFDKVRRTAQVAKTPSSPVAKPSPTTLSHQAASVLATLKPGQPVIKS